MKNFITMMVMVFFLMGCTNDFLEKEPKGAPTVSNFWKSEADLEAATNGLYLMNDFQGVYGRGIHLFSLIPSDDFVTGKPKGQIDGIKNFNTNSSGSYTRDIWSKHYVVIKRANDIIRNVTDLDIDSNAKNFGLGQAYFMRGLAYFQLSVIYGDEVYGGVPIVDESTTDFFVERPDHVSISYEFAALNFEKAAELLPYFEDLTPDQYGKAHKNAALGYLARTHLHNAQYDASSWAKVVSACDQVINSGKNTLENSFEDAFKIANNWGSEYIWSVPSNQEGGSIFPGASWEWDGYGEWFGWGYFNPTLEAYNSFEIGDIRREATILKYGDEFSYFGNTRKFFGSRNSTGFQLRKYINPMTIAGKGEVGLINAHPSTNLNVPLLRYSHILLMKSEALIMQGQNGDVPLNEVRQRAGLAAISNATLDNLKQERRSEFMAEIFGRYEDLCRWGDFSNIMMALHGRIHADKTDYASSFTVEEVWPSRPQFDINKHKIWPIPPNDISTSNGSLAPNGW